MIMTVLMMLGMISMEAFAETPRKLCPGDVVLVDFNSVDDTGADNNDDFAWTGNGAALARVQGSTDAENDWAIQYKITNAASYWYAAFELDNSKYILPDSGIIKFSFDGYFFGAPNLNFRGYKTWFGGNPNIITYRWHNSVEKKGSYGYSIPENTWIPLEYTYDIDNNLWTVVVNNTVLADNVPANTASTASTGTLGFTFNCNDLDSGFAVDNCRVEVLSNESAKIISPARGASIKAENVDVTVSAEGASSVNLYIDGMNEGEMTASSALFTKSVNFADYGTGTHSIKAVALYPNGSKHIAQQEINCLAGSLTWSEDFDTNLGEDNILSSDSYFITDIGKRKEDRNGGYALSLTQYGSYSAEDTTASILLNTEKAGISWPPTNGDVSIKFDAYTHLMTSAHNAHAFGICGLPNWNNTASNNMIYYRTLYYNGAKHTDSKGNAFALDENTWYTFDMNYSIDRQEWTMSIVNADTGAQYFDLTTPLEADMTKAITESFGIDVDNHAVWFDNISVSYTPSSISLSAPSNAVQGTDNLTFTLSEAADGLETGDVKVYVNGTPSSATVSISGAAISVPNTFKAGDEIRVAVKNDAIFVNTSAYVKIDSADGILIEDYSIANGADKAVANLFYSIRDRVSFKQYIAVYDSTKKLRGIETRTLVLAPENNFVSMDIELPEGCYAKAFIWEDAALVPVTLPAK